MNTLNKTQTTLNGIFVNDSYKHYYLQGKWEFAEWRMDRRPDWFPTNWYAKQYNKGVRAYNAKQPEIPTNINGGIKMKKKEIIARLTHIIYLYEVKKSPITAFNELINLKIELEE